MRSSSFCTSFSAERAMPMRFSSLISWGLRAQVLGVLVPVGQPDQGGPGQVARGLRAGHGARREGIGQAGSQRGDRGVAEIENLLFHDSLPHGREPLARKYTPSPARKGSPERGSSWTQRPLGAIMARLPGSGRESENASGDVHPHRKDTGTMVTKTETPPAAGKTQHFLQRVQLFSLLSTEEP